jgi:exonuclease VII large subunit
LIAEARQDLDRHTENLESALNQSLKDQQLKLQHLSDFLARATPLQAIKPYRERLKGLEAQLQAYHPHGPLKRGYAIVSRLETGEILRSPQGLKKGDRLGIQLQKGSLESEVSGLKEDKPE